MEKNKLKNPPNHVAIIINGLEEWSLERNLPFYDGINASYVSIKKIPECFFNYGVKTLTFYIFGYDIWKMNRNEVNDYMKQTRNNLITCLDYYKEKEFRVCFSGDIEELPGDISEICLNVQAETSINKNATINLCLNYNGEAEIISAIRKIIKNNISIDQVHKGVINKYIYNGGLGDIDLIIQTAGENNLKNSSVWQAQSAEIVFLKKHWPDFEKNDAEIIIKRYDASRE